MIAALKPAALWTLFLALSCPCAAWSADPVAPASRFPTSTYFFMSVPNAAELGTSWQQTALGRLLHDPEMAPFLASLEEASAEKREEFEEKTDFTLEQVAQLFHGEITVALFRPPSSKLTMGMVMEFGEQAEVAERILDKLIEAAEEDEDMTVRDVDLEGSAVTIMGLKEDAPDAAELGHWGLVCVAIRVTSFVVAFGEEGMAAILERWDGANERSFSANAIYRDIMDRCSAIHAKSSFEYFVDPIGLTQVGLQMMEELEQEVPFSMALLPLTGFDKLRGMGGVCEFGADEFSEHYTSVIAIDGVPSGLMNLFACTEEPIELPSFVDSSTASVVTVNWDLPTAYNAIRQMVDGLQGPGAFDTLVSSQLASAGVDLDINADVVNNLTGHMVMQTDEQGELDEESPGSLVWFEAANSARILQVLADLAGPALESRDFQGQTIYSTDGGAFTPAADAIVFADAPELVEEYVRGQVDGTLADDPVYVSLLSKVPARVFAFGFTRFDGQLVQAYELIRQGGLEGEGLTDDEDLAWLNDVDFSLLPPTETVRKFLAPSVSYWGSDTLGVIMRSMSAKVAD